MLNDAQNRALIALARWSVVATIDQGRGIPRPLAVDLPDAFGVFVTIKRRGELRGCLGTLKCLRGLAEEVIRCAADAATQDPRFPPVARNELADLAIQISVLGQLEAVLPVDLAAIVVGRHGLVVEEGVRRGLLLPQVATEWGWTVAQFLGQTCVKAGLPTDAWQHGARVFRFEAEVFGDPPSRARS
jgi:AmmeMemoRadiSam system protein A